MDSLALVAKPLIDFLSPISLAPVNIGVQITAIALPCLLLSETAHSTLGRYIFKPLASFGFLIAALSYIPHTATIAASSTTAATTFTSFSQLPTTVEGLLILATAYATELKHVLFNIAPTIAAGAGEAVVHTTYTRAVMGALVLGWIGDVLLIPVRGFLPGLASFLAGHAAFMVAFTFHGQDSVARQQGIGFVVTLLALVGPWLLPRIKNVVMRSAVLAYMLVISGMVVTAIASIHSGQDYLPERILGAFMFFTSDLYVARQQFIKKTVFNKWIGLPLYYGAQILLASTLRGEHVLHQ